MLLSQKNSKIDKRFGDHKTTKTWCEVSICNATKNKDKHLTRAPILRSYQYALNSLSLDWTNLIRGYQKDKIYAYSNKANEINEDKESNFWVKFTDSEISRETRQLRLGVSEVTEEQSNNSTKQI